MNRTVPVKGLLTLLTCGVQTWVYIQQTLAHAKAVGIADDGQPFPRSWPSGTRWLFARRLLYTLCSVRLPNANTAFLLMTTTTPVLLLSNLLTLSVDANDSNHH